MSIEMHRRYKLPVGAAVIAFALCASTASIADDAPHAPTTHIYKSIDGLGIHADVYRAAAGGPAPVAIWFHGGALITGNRTHVDSRLRDGMLKSGVHFVSADYRLAPETKLPDILADVADAFRWVREKGPELFGADPDHVAAVGMSAGGYLALASGHCVEPPPSAIVSLYGYGELTSAWYGEPSEYYRQRPIVSRGEALATVGERPLTDGAMKGSNRYAFYLYCRQQGRWPLEVAGVDPKIDNRAFDPWCPLRNVSPRFPSTMLLHGTLDDDVPYEQSVSMAKELARHGVEHRLITIENGRHGFFGGDKAKIEQAYSHAIEFLHAHLDN